MIELLPPQVTCSMKNFLMDMVARGSTLIYYVGQITQTTPHLYNLKVLLVQDPSNYSSLLIFFNLFLRIFLSIFGHMLGIVCIF